MRRITVLSILTAFSLFISSCQGDGIITIYPVRIGDHWGYVNEKGKYIFNPTLDEADCFRCGVARCKCDGKLGYINRKGKYAIDPVYSGGTTFSEGKAFVVRDGEDLECINTSGKVLFTLEGVEWAHNFHEGLARFTTIEGQKGFVNEKGEIVIEPKYQKVGDFSEGLACVQSEDISGYIDKKGNLVFNAKPDRMYKFVEGLAVNNIDGGKYGFIDKKGEIKISFQFDYASPFSEEVASVKTGGKYGYINKRGSYVINPQFDYSGSFSEGKAVVRNGTEYGYVNHRGKLVIKPIFKYGYDFVGGYAFVKTSDDLYGIINSKGDFVVQPQFSDAKDPDDYVIGIRSRKFYGKNFVPEFLKRFTDEGWDGLNGTTTLKTIRNIYKNAEASGDTDFVCETTFEAIDGVKVAKLQFGFGEKTYKIITTYSRSWWYSFATGTKKQYFDELSLKTLQYTFSLEGNAVFKAKSVAEALSEGIGETYGVNAIKEENSISIPATEKTPKTVLTWSTDNVYMTLEYAEPLAETTNSSVDRPQQSTIIL